MSGSLIFDVQQLREKRLPEAAIRELSKCGNRINDECFTIDLQGSCACAVALRHGLDLAILEDASRNDKPAAGSTKDIPLQGPGSPKTRRAGCGKCQGRHLR